MNMCELLALSCNRSVDVVLSFSELARHGGETGAHTDGWGVAFYEGADAMVVREPHAAARSAWVKCLAENPFTSRTVIAHIRKATQGEISLRNTQPFQREFGGRIHVFAHNGNIQGIVPLQHMATDRFTPVGDTDSEAAFCLFLNRLSAAAPGSGSPPFELTWQLFLQLARELMSYGPANILYSNGTHIFAHADRRWQVSGRIEPPGLMLLERQCAPEPISNDYSGISFAGDVQTVALLASVPLTAAGWRPLARGTVIALADGRVVREEFVASDGENLARGSVT
jgi:glutamine amidotransferase